MEQYYINKSIFYISHLFTTIVACTTRANTRPCGNISAAQGTIKTILLISKRGRFLAYDK